MYGPVRTVVWQGSVGDRRPYADQVGLWEVTAVSVQLTDSRYVGQVHFLPNRLAALFRQPG